MYFIIRQRGISTKNARYRSVRQSDTQDSDIKYHICGALQAACHPVMVPDMTQPKEEIRAMAEFVCKDMYEALELIRNRYFEGEKTAG